jgi:hypothetical protein
MNPISLIQIIKNTITENENINIERGDFVSIKKYNTAGMVLNVYPNGKLKVKLSKNNKDVIINSDDAVVLSENSESLNESKSLYLKYGNSNIQFKPFFNEGYLTLMPKTSEDLTMIDMIKSEMGENSDEKFINLTLNQIQKLTGIKFIHDWSSIAKKGAGYKFRIDDEFILSKLM